MVHRAARGQRPAGHLGPGHPGGAPAGGAPRGRARSGRQLRAGARAAVAGVRHRQLLEGVARAARHRGDFRGHPRGPGRHGDGILPRHRQACRQALPDEVTRDRAGGWRADQAGEGVVRRSRRAGADNLARDAERRGVLLVREGPGAGRPADGGEREGGLPAVGRHRLAGGRVAHDEARLLGDPRALPQLPVPFARLPGEGARDGANADDLATAEPAVPRSRSASCSARSS